MTIEDRFTSPFHDVVTSQEIGTFNSELPEQDVYTAASALVVSLALGVGEGLRRLADGSFDFTGVIIGQEAVRAFTERDSLIALQLDTHAPRTDGAAWLDSAFELASEPHLQVAIRQNPYLNE